MLPGVPLKFLEGQIDLIYDQTNDILHNSLSFFAYTNKWGDPIILIGLWSPNGSSMQIAFNHTSDTDRHFRNPCLSVYPLISERKFCEL